ncbi:MAG: hypothetical protein PUG23_09815 [Lachnospiraceae bacterium]|nr:hypothetical protein [Lachnospiraceae bacterium]
MVVLKKWRFHMSDDGSFILTGIGKYDRLVRVPIQQDNIQYAKLDTSYLQINTKDRLEGYLLWFKDADMSKAIAPMRAVKRQPKQSTIDAVYCMMAEASMYLCGLVKEVDKDYLRRTKPLNLFLNSASDDDGAFNLDIAVEILLKAGAKEKISPLDKFI